MPLTNKSDATINESKGGYSAINTPEVNKIIPPNIIRTSLIITLHMYYYLSPDALIYIKNLDYQIHRFLSECK